MSHNQGMQVASEEAPTLGVFAGALLALLGMTMAANEDGSGFARGLGLSLVAAGLVVMWTFWRLLRTRTAPVAAAYEPEDACNGERGDGTRVLPAGTFIDDRIWRLRMRLLSTLVRCQRRSRTEPRSRHDAR